MRAILSAAIFVVALPTIVAAASVDAPEKASDSADKVVCKRFIETGSLVKGYRVCKTKAEWVRERENIRTRNGMSGSCSSAETGVCGPESAIHG